MVALLDRASLRPRPLNRAYPREGHWTATCPLCGREDGLWIEPGMVTWTSDCTRGEQSIFELHAILLIGAVA